MYSTHNTFFRRIYIYTYFFTRIYKLIQIRVLQSNSRWLSYVHLYGHIRLFPLGSTDETGAVSPLKPGESWPGWAACGRLTVKLVGDLKIPKHPRVPCRELTYSCSSFHAWEEDFPYAIGGLLVSLDESWQDPSETLGRLDGAWGRFFFKVTR